MRLCIIRHADPDYPNNTITPEGHLEAAALGVRMAKLGVNRIYSSPLGRAVHTMQYTVDALGDATGILPSIEEWRAHRERIAVFCHGGFGLWWLAHRLELPLPLVWTGFHLPPSSVTTVLFDERSQQWAVPR